MTVDFLIERLADMTSSRPRVECGGRELVCSCPFCGGENDLYVNPAKSVFHCFRCDESGTLRDLLDAEVPIVVTGIPDFVDEDEEKDGTFWCPGSVTPLDHLPADHPAVAYVRSRGFDPVELSQSYDVGVVGGDGIHVCRWPSAGCLFLPITENGHRIGWQIRPPRPTVADEPKYRSMYGYRKKRHLVYADRARGFPFVVVCEGLLDAIRVGPPAVAIIGKQPSQRQLDLLVAGWPTIVLLLDPDAAAEQANAARELADKAAVVSVPLNGYKDAGEATRAAVWAAIRAAADEQGVTLPDIHNFGAAPADSDPEIDAGNHKTSTEG